MYYFKGFCGGGSDVKDLYLEADGLDLYSFGMRLFSQVDEYVSQQNNLEFYIERYDGSMPCEDKYGERIQGCGYVYVTMQESNLFDSDETFEDFWEDILKTVCRHRY